MNSFFRTISIIFTSLSLIHCEAPPATNPHTSATSAQHTQTSSATSLEVIENQNQTIESLRNTLVQTYAAYWPHLAEDFQHEQLPIVLTNPIPELRVFGVERIAVLLRDGEATNEELQLVIEKLRDHDVSVRLAASKLLPEINVPGLPEYVANSLSTEANEEVINRELAYFRTHPSPLAIPPTVQLFVQTKNIDAAETLVALLSMYRVSDETTQKVLREVKKLRRTNANTSLITLEAMLGTERDKRTLARLLESTNESVRVAVAKGFASAGYAEPLIKYSSDKQLYDYLLVALQKDATINSFKLLMDLYKDSNETWDLSAFEIATKLNTSDFLRADDMLKRIERDDLRILILEHLWKSAGEKSRAAQKAIARRAVPLMVKNGNAVEALQLLDFFGDSLEEDLLVLRFNAAISASAWDAAADAVSDPNSWIAVWESSLQTDPTAAAVIAQQILMRFDDQLSYEQKEKLGVIQVDASNEPEQE